MTNERMVRKLMDCRADAKHRVGHKGWSMLSVELQDALTAVEVLRVIAANDETEGWQQASRFASFTLRGEI